MQYVEFDPGPALAEQVLRYWRVTVPASAPAGLRHSVLPDGCIALVAIFQGDMRHLTLQGPHDQPLQVPVSPGDRFWGIRFWPDTGGRVLGCAPVGLRDSMSPAAAVLGSAAGELTAQLAPVRETPDAAMIMDRWLAPRVALAQPPDPAVRLAVLAIVAGVGSAPVTELAALVGLSPRQLQRRFRAATGLTLKTYARIRRLRASLDHLISGARRSWAEVAADLGFADQAHLTREFTRLAGATPAVVAAYVAGIEHRGVRL